MIFVKCENNFLTKQFSNIFIQCGMPFTTNPETKVFINLYLEITDKNLKVKNEKEIFLLPLPIEVEEFNKKIIQQFQNFVFSYNSIQYYPLKQVVIFKKKEVILRNTHNLIFRQLLLNINQDGINKRDLYYQIWPNDKNLQLNKLDTHLTNLKNYLLSELELEIIILTKNNKTNLIID